MFGGVQTERIQLNEKSLWSGGPSDSRPEYNGGNIESKGQNGKVMAQLKEKLKKRTRGLTVILQDSLLESVMTPEYRDTDII